MVGKRGWGRSSGLAFSSPQVRTRLEGSGVDEKGGVRPPPRGSAPTK